jgi:hypothetical protein
MFGDEYTSWSSDMLCMTVSLPSVFIKCPIFRLIS